MEFPPARSDSGQAFTSRTPSFYSVLIYQDIATGIRAKDVANRIRQEIGDERTFELDAWNAALLDDPVFNKIASQQAEAAEIVILSLRNGNAFTPRLKNWFGAWTSRKLGVFPALVALFAEPRCSSTIFAKSYLETAAARAGMEFLCQSLDHSDDATSSAKTELCWIL